MKILQLCNRIPFPLVDGGAIAMFAMTKSFANAGCEVHTLAINTKKHFVEPSTIPEWFTEKTELYTVTADTDVKISGAIANLFSTSSYNLVRFDIPDYHKKLEVLLKEHNYDVVQLEGLFLSMYIPTIRKNSTALISMRAHNVEYLIWERMAFNTRSFIKKKYLNLLASRLKREEVEALNQVDCIVPISSVDEKTYRNLGARIPMLVCTGGVEEDLLLFRPDKVEENSLFHMGAMNWQPNVQAADWLLQKIWPLVKVKFPTAKLYLAGKDMQARYFKSQNQQLHVIGRVNNAFEFMLSKNIMLVPLLSGSGMRIKIVEGMALGKVIISTSIGAEGIAYTHKINILIADSPEEFAAAVELALTNAELCQQISENARELVSEKYTNTTIVKALLHFYESLLTTPSK